MKLTIQVQYLPTIPTIEGVLVWSEKWIVRYFQQSTPPRGTAVFRRKPRVSPRRHRCQIVWASTRAGCGCPGHPTPLSNKRTHRSNQVHGGVGLPVSEFNNSITVGCKQSVSTARACNKESKWRSEPASAPRSFLDRRCHYSVHTLKAM